SRTNCLTPKVEFDHLRQAARRMVPEGGTMSSDPSIRKRRHGTTQKSLCVGTARRWSARALLAWLGVLALLSNCPAANAQSNVSAREEWYGIYEKKETAASFPSNDSDLIAIPPKSNTDRIPGRQGVSFGVSFVLSGGKSDVVDVKRVMRFPHGMTYVIPLTFPVGQPQLLSYEFKSAPRDDFFGEWSFELWQGDRKLLERRFTVYRP